jgi:adenosine kinase
MRTLICGSIAYDTIMVFHDRFKHHILPEQIHILNVAFLVPDMRREFGGTAGNIAYNLKLLGGEPVVMATVGDDCAPYVERLRTLGIADAHVRQVPQTFTAQAFITTDLDDNQITAFHPGAMNHSHMNKVSDAGDIRLAIVAPDGRDGMFQHAAQLRDAGIPFIFDPGQGMPMFGADDLLHFMDLADYCTVNDYEAKLMAQKTGRSIEELARMVRALVVTLGAEGSEIHVEGRVIRIPSAAPEAEVDPTGCGDAFRAGLIHGINHGLDWAQTGRLASLMGAIKIAHRGGQNHSPTRDEIGARYRASFGSSIW